MRACPIFLVLELPSSPYLASGGQTTKTVGGTAGANSVICTFQAFPVGELKAKNMESAVVVSELPIIMPTRMVSERIRHGPHSLNNAII